VRDSEHAGIAIVFQELSLVKELTVGENIFLGREPSRLGIVNWSALYHRASTLLNDLHLPIDPSIEVGNLGIGQQQLVEIAKALSQSAKILVLAPETYCSRCRHYLHLAQTRRGLRYGGSHHRSPRR
jgi:D-xylose transport system ATP-binding protein